MNNLMSRRDEFFTPIERQFDQFFSQFFDDGRRNYKNILKDGSYPKADTITTNDGKYIVEAAVPGVQHKDIQVEILPSGILQISGKMESDVSYSQATFYQKELKRSSFTRNIVLPDNLIGDPEATFGNGILKLTWNIKQTPPKDENRKVIAVKNNDADLPKCERQAEGKEPFDKSGILRYEIFTSAPINYNPKHKLTNEKIYPILCEASDDTRILYTTIDDCGNTIVVDAANFQAITEESLARHKSGVGKSEKWCEEVRKSINESVSHIGFNGKHTTYRLGYKNINPSSIKGSVYVDDDVICLFTVNDSNALILAPSRDQDEFYILRGNADIDNSTIHLDWNIVPPQTNVVVSYEYQMNIFGAKRSTEYASKIDKKFSSNGDIVFSIKDDKSLSESEDIKVSRELSMEETWRALAGVNGVELDLVKQKAV